MLKQFLNNLFASSQMMNVRKGYNEQKQFAEDIDNWTKAEGSQWNQYSFSTNFVIVYSERGTFYSLPSGRTRPK